MARKFRGVFPPESWHDENLPREGGEWDGPVPTPLQHRLIVEAFRIAEYALEAETARKERERRKQEGKMP